MVTGGFMNATVTSSNATVANLSNLKFVQDGYELFMDKKSFYLVKENSIHMMFNHSFSHDSDNTNCLFSLCNQNLASPIPVDTCRFEAIRVNLEEIGVILSLAIENAYTDKIYVENVQKRILELNNHSYYLALFDMFEQSVPSDSRANIWDKVFREPPIFLTNNPEFTNTLLFGSMLEKKHVLRLVLGHAIYNTLNIQKRGRRYIDALVGRLLALYLVD